MPKKQPAKVESPTRKSQRIAPKKPDKQIKQADKYKFHGTKGEKPFECLLCGRYYASKTTWYRHNSSKHAVNDYYSGSQKTTKQKTYRCLYCKESQMTHWFSEKHVPKCLFKHKQVTLCQNSSSRKRNPATLTADGFKYTEYDNTGAVLSIRFATNKATSNEGNEGYELLSPPKLSPLQKISHWVRPWDKSTYLTVSNKKLPCQTSPQLTLDQQMVPSGLKRMERNVDNLINPKTSTIKKHLTHEFDAVFESSPSAPLGSSLKQSGMKRFKLSFGK